MSAAERLPLTEKHFGIILYKAFPKKSKYFILIMRFEAMRKGKREGVTEVMHSSRAFFTVFETVSGKKRRPAIYKKIKIAVKIYPKECLFKIA